MSFSRHREIYPPMEAQTNPVGAPAHRLDEFPAGYSLAGCSPAEPASASPAGHQYAVKSFCRSSIFQRTANSVLTVCVSPGGKRRKMPGVLSNTSSYLAQPQTKRWVLCPFMPLMGGEVGLVHEVLGRSCRPISVPRSDTWVVSYFGLWASAVRCL